MRWERRSEWVTEDGLGIRRPGKGQGMCGLRAVGRSVGSISVKRQTTDILPSQDVFNKKEIPLLPRKEWMNGGTRLRRRDGSGGCWRNAGETSWWPGLGRWEQK